MVLINDDGDNDSDECRLISWIIWRTRRWESNTRYTRRRCLGSLDYFYSEPEIARKYVVPLCITRSLSPFPLLRVYSTTQYWCLPNECMFSASYYLESHWNWIICFEYDVCWISIFLHAHTVRKEIFLEEWTQSIDERKYVVNCTDIEWMGERKCARHTRGNDKSRRMWLRI